MRYKLLACEILYREICAVVARSKNKVDVEFMPKALHDIGHERMRSHLGEALAAVDESQYDAVLLGYGLCSYGVTQLTTREVPMVIPRAHDCITLFLGDRSRYLEYFHANPGTYFKTTGWIERGDDLVQLSPDSMQRELGIPDSYEELVEQYGEENAEFLWEKLGGMSNYGKLTFIETGVEPDERFERHTQDLAQERGWTYEKLSGDLRLLQQLVDGDWPETEFLVLQPGQSIAASYDDDIVEPAR